MLVANFARFKVCDMPMMYAVCSLQHVMLLSRDNRLSDGIEQGWRHLWACRTTESSLRTWCWPNERQAFVEEGSFRYNQVDSTSCKHTDSETPENSTS